MDGALSKLFSLLDFAATDLVTHSRGAKVCDSPPLMISSLIRLLNRRITWTPPRDSSVNLASIYSKLRLIRRVEEEIARIYPTDKIKSPVHLSIGQESVSVGVCDALRPSDIVFGTYRGHALYLAKGGDINRMVAELYGKATGCTKGKGGSMHLIDVQAGVMSTAAI